MRCGDCRFFMRYEAPKNKGLCRFDPPTVFASFKKREEHCNCEYEHADACIAMVSPEMFESEFCGRFKPIRPGSVRLLKKEPTQ